MLQRIIDFSLKNRFLVLLATLALVLGGIYAVRSIPLDAIPDLSDVQVIIYSEWPGQAPQIVQDQVTYLLWLFLRLCDFRGWHGPLLGAQPGARIPEQPRLAVA
jgi:Cu/Ag efflux pump CusA